MPKFHILANRELSLHPHCYCIYFMIQNMRFGKNNMATNTLLEGGSQT